MYWRKSSPGWHINYLNYTFLRRLQRRMDRESVQRGKTGRHFYLFIFFFLKCNGGTKAKSIRWKSTPPFCWFSDQHNDNNFLTIWCLLHLPVATQTKRSLRIRREKNCSNMVLRVYSDHTICFRKSTFKTALWAVPTALSLKLGLTSHSPLCYFPSV